MWLLAAVTVLALLKALVYLQVLQMAGVAALSWWVVVAGYALCAAWFTYADLSGLTSRRAQQRLEKRKQEREKKQREMLGLQRKR